LSLNAARLRRVAQRLVRGPVHHIKTLAERQWTIAPAESSCVPPAIYLEGAIERIRGLSQWRHWEVEQRLIRGEQLDHAPCTACLVRDVDLVGAFLYKGAAIDQPGYGRDAWWLPGAGPSERLSDAELVTTRNGSLYFGCWLLDEMPLALLMDGARKIRMCSQPYQHEAGYREILDQPAPRLVRRARIDRLTLYSDVGQNRSREERYRRLRARMRSHLDESKIDAPAGVYIKRGDSGEPRIVANESEVEALMRRLGFRIVDPMGLSAEEVARLTLDARIVVGVEGSHLSHAIYSMADEACLVVLQPPARFSLAYKEYTDRMAMRLAFVVGEPHPLGFTVALHEVERTIELAARALREARS
jgi:hypothetical protein